VELGKNASKIDESYLSLSKMLALLQKKDYNTPMNKTLRKIIAITALIFMLAFIAFLMMYLIDKNLLNGAVGLITIFAGCLAIGLYLVIVFDNKYGKEAQKKRMEEFLKEQEKAEKEAEEEAKKAGESELSEEEKLDIVKEENK